MQLVVSLNESQIKFIATSLGKFPSDVTPVDVKNYIRQLEKAFPEDSKAGRKKSSKIAK